MEKHYRTSTMTMTLFKSPSGDRVIMLTCPCNEDPLTSHVYLVTGVYNIFLFLL